MTKPNSLRAPRIATGSLGSILVALALTVPRVARADASLADKAAAQSLYDEGRRLMTEGNYAQACPKLAESEKLDPGVGTKFHLADCYEHLGQTASAWAGFLEVASSAKAMGQTDREKVARDRAAALVPRLSRLTITSQAPESLSGAKIKRDGADVGRALWGTAIAVDPGTHTIEVTEPGKKPWQTTVQVSGDQANVVVKIPQLDDAPNVAAGGNIDSAHPGIGNGRRTLGLTIGAVGLVGVGVGTAFAVVAKSKYNDSLNHCDTGDKNVCDIDGVSKRDSARSAGNAATIAFGLGGAALVAGAVLFFTAPTERAANADPNKARVDWSLAVAPGRAGFVVRGAY